MIFSLNFVFFLLLIFLVLNVFVFSLFLIQKFLNNKRKTLEGKFQDFLVKYFTGDSTYSDFPAQILPFKDKYIFLKQFSRIKESIVINPRQNEEIIRRFLGLKFFNGLIRKLESPFKFSRVKAAVCLGTIGTLPVQQKLISALENESDFTVKQYIANALADTENPDIVPHLIKSLPGSSAAYRIFTINLIINFGSGVYKLIKPLLESSRKEYKYLVLDYCRKHLTPVLEVFIKSMARSDNDELGIYAAKILLDHYHNLLAAEDYLKHNNKDVRSLAVQALGKQNEKDNILKLIEFLGDPSVSEDAVVGLSNLLRHRPQFISFLLERFEIEKDPEKKLLLAKVLSFRIEYFLANILSSDSKTVKSLIKETLELGQSSAIIGFLNRNNEEKLENEIISIIGEVSKHDKLLEKELQYYLDEDILEKFGLQRIKLKSKRVVPEKDQTSIRILYASLIFSILIMPAFFLLTKWSVLEGLTGTNIIKLFILQFNYGLVYYSSTINLLYIVLLLISAWGIYKQRKYWRIKETSFLFKPGVLPSISIIAPAYNEVANIIESTSSLLNLKYPRYEVVVVNDGSKDDTLTRIIEHFNLEKVDKKIQSKINTMPIRGVYANKEIPKLIVVDKANGGKADSLNVGINVSRFDYVCGIDADSLLEEKALLKIAAGMIDIGDESVAAGGNILPVNGCTVEKGDLTEIKIPKNPVAKFQTIEYMRAFLAGRVGWSQLRSLLIISGAFGLFKKDRVIQIGGYLTASGELKKDTVGEDMELVVRLSRYMREKKVRHRFLYVFNANCWTEVPEQMEILSAQRDRWQRGLLDILTYHRKMAFNPAYGTTGLIGFPYYIIFEAVGPLFELQAYIMVIIAGFFGMLNTSIAILLFISTILMGILISLSSLLISGDEVNRFSTKESFILLGYAVLENFGFRQYLSLLRVSGYLNSLRRPKGWGKMVRKGIGTAA